MDEYFAFNVYKEQAGDDGMLFFYAHTCPADGHENDDLMLIGVSSDGLEMYKDDAGNRVLLQPLTKNEYLARLYGE